MPLLSIILTFSITRSCKRTPSISTASFLTASVSSCMAGLFDLRQDAKDGVNLAVRCWIVIRSALFGACFSIRCDRTGNSGSKVSWWKYSKMNKVLVARMYAENESQKQVRIFNFSPEDSENTCMDSHTVIWVQEHMEAGNTNRKIIQQIKHSQITIESSPLRAWRTPFTTVDGVSLLLATFNKASATSVCFPFTFRLEATACEN